jgi:hypothetical protein
MASDKAVKVTGGCLCGGVRYEAEAYLSSAYYCHCTLCQRNNGAPFEIGIPVKSGTLRFVEGEPSWYMAKSTGYRGFCATCGSRLAWKPSDPADDWATNIVPGSLDDASGVRPQEHTFTDTRQPWFQMNDGLPNYTEAEMGPVSARWKAERT